MIGVRIACEAGHKTPESWVQVATPWRRQEDTEAADSDSAMIQSVLEQGVQGMRRAQSAIAETAHDIATEPVAKGESSAGSPEERNRPSLVESLVELKQQSQLFQANGKVVEVGAKALRSLLDELA